MPTSLEGNNYLCTFTDVATRLTTTAYLKTKDTAKYKYIDYCKYIKNKTGRYPLYVHTDGGGEFIDKELQEFNTKKGITHTFTSPNSSVQNPIAERVNRTIGEGSLALLTSANLPSSFWEHSVSAFVFIKNRTPHKHLHLSNPITEWNIHNAGSSSLDLQDLRIFGSEGYVLDERANKNNPKAFRCIYLGPCEDHKGSKFFNLYTKKIVRSRNFVINEQIRPGEEIYLNLYDKNFGPPPPPQNIDSVQSTSTTNSSPSTSPSSPSFTPTSSISSSSTSISDSPDLSTSSNTSVPTSDIDLDSDIPSHPSILPTPTEPNSSNQSPSVIEIPDSDVSHFDRNINQQVGVGDMPGLEPPSDCESTTDETPVDTINGQPAYEIESVIGKRKSLFTKDGADRVGGARFWKPSYGYDYEILWTTGETSWEPEEQVDAPDKVEEYETSLLQPTTATPNQADPSPTSDPPKESTTLTNICNFVHLHFFCFLAKLPFQNCSEWKKIKVPQTQAEARASPESELWLAAEEEEMKQLLLNKTWKNFKGKPPKKPITCRWVYKLKPPTSLQPKPIFKARLVAHGYKQKAYLDYGATFAQVATTKAFRILVWIATVFGYRATQWDFKSAFLHGKIDREIYMTGPPGHCEEGTVVLLQKSLYGIKQAPRIWYQSLVTHLNSLGFKATISDSCVLKHHTEKFYILIFVDDLICVEKNSNLRDIVEKSLKANFHIKLLGKLKHFVGYQIEEQADGSVLVHQRDYAQKVVDIFMKYLPTAIFHYSPADSTRQFSQTQQPTTPSEKQKMQKYPYRQLIGSLLYLLGTRPELYFIIITLSRFVTNPGWLHWLGALYVLIYIRGSIGRGILFKKLQSFQLSVYVDADWGSNRDDRKSISGYIIYLGSTPIIWRSKRQKGKSAISSCEAEYVSLSQCINEVVWLVSFLKELGFNLPLPIPIYCDNKSAKDLAYNPVHHDRTKHIDIAYHRIREFILDGTIRILHVPSQNNPADLFTKSTKPAIFKRLLDYLYDSSINLPD